MLIIKAMYHPLTPRNLANAYLSYLFYFIIYFVENPVGNNCKFHILLVNSFFHILFSFLIQGPRATLLQIPITWNK